jgi:hypothetical protein
LKDNFGTFNLLQNKNTLIEELIPIFRFNLLEKLKHTLWNSCLVILFGANILKGSFFLVCYSNFGIFFFPTYWFYDWYLVGILIFFILDYSWIFNLLLEKNETFYCTRWLGELIWISIHNIWGGIFYSLMNQMQSCNFKVC